MSFWGLKLECGKRYSTTVETTFHVSKAVLDIATADRDETVSVMLQEDLNFSTGERITLFCKGRGVVYLSGYMVTDDDDEYSKLLDEEEEDEEEVEEELFNKNKTSQQIKKGKAPENKKKPSLPMDEDDEEVEEELFNKKKTPQQIKKEKASPENKKKPSLPMDEDDSDDDMEENSDEAVEEESDEDEESEEEEEAPQPKIKKLNVLKQNGAPNLKRKIETKEKAGDGIKKKETDGKSPATKEGNKVLSGGVIVKDLKPGNGPVAQHGKRVVVTYTGRLKSNNKVFDSCNKGPGFSFTLGKGEVIKGWDVGVAGMKVGGKRILTIPPQMAYGSKGAPPDIPPNSTLVFFVQLKAIN